jgi:transketolase
MVDTQGYSLKKLETIATQIRVDLIKMLEHAGSGHSAGPLPHKPEWDQRDILVLSNGHCVPVRYAAMAHAGYFPKKELMTLRQFGSRLQGHPERQRLPGLETTSGPLGCGLSQAAGMALAMRMDNIHNRWIYVAMSDGEQDEGNIWEAAMLASKYKLNNVIAITDRNNIQIDGLTENIMPLENLKDKWEAFGWYVIEIDGNDIEAVIDACNMAKAIVDKPVMIIAHTIPGKGVDFMEYDFHWHGTPPGVQDIAGSPAKAKQAQEALKQLRTLQGRIRSEHE